MFNFESTSFSDFALSTCRFSEYILAIVTGDYGLSVAENNIGLVASSAFNVHEVRVRGGDESFQFMCIFLLFKGWVEQVSFHLLNIISDNIYKYIILFYFNFFMLSYWLILFLSQSSIFNSSVIKFVIKTLFYD